MGALHLSSISWRRALAFTAGAGVCVALDQISKQFMLNYLAQGPKPFIPGVIQLVLTGNTGAAFSMGEGHQFIFVLITCVIFVAALLWVSTDKNMPLTLSASLCMVAGGGLGNLVDRVSSGSVVDFFATEFMSFPIFNVADIFVTVGVVLAFISWWRYDARLEHASEQTDEHMSGHSGSHSR